MMRAISSYTATLLICVLGLAPAVSAQDVYVKDTLRVGVRTEPGNQIAPIAVVTTGMRLRILQDRGDFIKIRTEDGIEGWVRASYVGEEAPAAIQLKQLQTAFDQLQARVDQQQELVNTGKQDKQTMLNELALLRKANSRLRTQLQEHENQAMQSAFGYVWKSLLVLIICMVGFSIGVSWHRSRAMKRLGGLRV